MKGIDRILRRLAFLLTGLSFMVALLFLMLGLLERIHLGKDAPASAEEEIAVESTRILPKPLMDPEGMRGSPDWDLMDAEPNASEIKYGKELIARTSEYFGPDGKIKKMSNGMNCQNCHLKAGTVPLGNNYFAVASTYPTVRSRSGELEDIPKRINDCLERSLNGEPLERSSREMTAIVAYMQWLGKGVPKGERPLGAGIYEVPPMDRAADPVKGKTVYNLHCESCHMENGKGQLKVGESGYLYPPLWGENSYNQGAGLFRISRFAGYVKANMPFGTTYKYPVLSDEEAWDVAAYVNSMQRPIKDFPDDWPDISKKPVDHPFGPYSDKFTEREHKYGPFLPIITSQK